jgi:hypothetical protein
VQELPGADRAWQCDVHERRVRPLLRSELCRLRERAVLQK